MNKRFKRFLKNNEQKKSLFMRDKILRPDGSICHHDKDHWCQNCVARPEFVEVKLPNGKVSGGYIMGNGAKEVIDMLKDREEKG